MAARPQAAAEAAACLFVKHGVDRGSVRVEEVRYHVHLRRVVVEFEVAACGFQQAFEAQLPFDRAAPAAAGDAALLDAAFDAVSPDLDAWLEVLARLVSARHALEGLVVHECGRKGG